MSAPAESMTSTDRPVRHSQIALALRHELAQGHWPVGSQLPTTRVLAHQFRASLLTVRQALVELAGQGLVQSRRGSGVYVTALPTDHPPRLISRLAVVVPSERYFRCSIAGIHTVADPRGIQTTVGFSDYDRDEEVDLVTQAIRAGADALILAPASRSKLDDTLWHDLLGELRIPAVFIERNPPEEVSRAVSHVTSNVRQGTRDAINHLTSHGCHRIALYAPHLEQLWPEVLEGFVAALHHAGRPLIGELVEAGGTGCGPEEFAHRCVEFGADGLFCTRESDTLRILRSLRHQGLGVPDDIAIMEFCDDLAGTAEVPLSGIGQRRTEVGEMAVRLLLRQIDTGVDSACHVSYRPLLMLRRSCGCAGPD